jgi:hypothetical protein
MKLRYIFGIITVILIAVFYQVLQRKHIEQFQQEEEEDGKEFSNIIDAPKTEAVPAKVYFNKTPEHCDFPGTYFLGGVSSEDLRINFNYDVTYYKKLQELLKKMYPDPPPSEYVPIFLDLAELIKQYEQFPGENRIDCSLTLPNWYNLRPVYQEGKIEDKVVFGDIPQNEARGSPEHWAFIGKENLLSGEADGYGLKMETVDDTGEYYYQKLDNGKTYAYGTLKNFTAENIRQLYCKEAAPERNFHIVCGFQIDPETSVIRIIKNDTVVDAEDLDDLTLMRYLKPFFDYQYTRDDGVNEILLIKSQSKTFPAIRIVKDVCGTKKKQIIPINLTVKFSKDITLKVIPNGDSTTYYQGTYATLLKNDADLNALIEKNRAALARAKGELDTANQNYDNAFRRYMDERENKRQEDQRKQQLANKITSYNRYRWYRYRYGFNHFIYTYRDYFASIRKLKQIDNNITLYEQETNSARAVLQTKQNEVDRANDELNTSIKMKDTINDYRALMNQELIKGIRSAVHQKQFIVSFVPFEAYKYISYDGFLYIVLE